MLQMRTSGYYNSHYQGQNYVTIREQQVSYWTIVSFPPKREGIKLEKTVDYLI